MAQSKTIQLLRSSQAYASIEAAKTAIQGLAGERKDGEILLGRYWSGTGNNAVIKSVLAVYHAAPDLEGTGITEGTTKGWTFIQDITSSSEGLQALQNEVDAIETALGFNTDGTKGNFTDTDALQIIAADDTIAAAVEKVAKALGALDKTASAVDGKVVTTVAQTNGLVSETQADLTDIKMGGYSKTADTGAIAATDTLEVAVSKLENGIAAATVKSTDKTVNITNNDGKDLSVNIDGTTLVKNASTGAISSDLKIIKETSGLATNVKEQYKLVYGNSTSAIGEPINIYKDSALLSVKLLHATDSLKPSYNKSTDTWTDIASASQTEENLALCYAYENANGVVVVEAVPVGDFLRESEFKNGLQVASNGEVSVLIDPASEKVTTALNTQSDVLSVSASGVKVSNIQAAINYAVQNASADLAVTAAGDNVYISAAQDGNDNKKINVTGTYGSFNTPTAQSNTLSATTNGIAKAEDVATAVNTVISNLDGSATATAASGDVYTVLTSVTETDGVIAKGGEVTLAAVAKTGAASDVALTDTAGNFTNDNVESALAELATSINNNHIVNNDVITVATDTTNHNTKLTVTTGNGLEKSSNTLQVKDGAGITVDSNGVSVNAGDGLEIASDAVKVKIDTTTTGHSDMLSVSSAGVFLSDTWDCGTF